MVRTGPLIALLCALLSGCLHDFDGDGMLRLGVAGDSNSSAPWQWVGMAQAVSPPQVQWQNAAVPGAWCKYQGPGQINTLTADGADGIVLAFGTNDVLGLCVGCVAQTARQVADCYHERVAQAGGRQVIVATTPPIYAPGSDAVNAVIDELNALVRAEFPNVVEFHDGFGPEHFAPDGVHLNEAGQRMRRDRGLVALAAVE